LILLAGGVIVAGIFGSGVTLGGSNGQQDTKIREYILAGHAFASCFDPGWIYPVVPLGLLPIPD
jgi:hypothetical protein